MRLLLAIESLPSPTAMPAASSSSSGAMPCPSLAFDTGQCATATPTSAIVCDVDRVDTNAVNEQRRVGEHTEGWRAVGSGEAAAGVDARFRVVAARRQMVRSRRR